MSKSKVQSKTLKRFDLTGKTALVTGGGGLLGIQHAYALLESGAEVVLTDISSTSLFDAKEQLSLVFDPKKITTFEMDVTDKNGVQSVACELTRGNRIVDILINNAAVDPKIKVGNKITNTSRLENFELDDWNFQISVGLTGAFLCSQIFGDCMVKNKKQGVILNIASDLSVIAPDQRIYQISGVKEEDQNVKPVTYSVIKSGLVGLTRYLATYWGDKGIRVNALSPGGVWDKQDKKFVRSLTSLIPMGRMADKEEYHSVVQFLCSDASSYMTGQNIVMDGGRSVW